MLYRDRDHCHSPEQLVHECQHHRESRFYPFSGLYEIHECVKRHFVVYPAFQEKPPCRHDIAFLQHEQQRQMIHRRDDHEHQHHEVLRFEHARRSVERIYVYLSRAYRISQICKHALLPLQYPVAVCAFQVFFHLFRDASALLGLPLYKIRYHCVCNIGISYSQTFFRRVERRIFLHIYRCDIGTDAVQRSAELRSHEYRYQADRNEKPVIFL